VGEGQAQAEQVISAKIAPGRGEDKAGSRLRLAPAGDRS